MNATGSASCMNMRDPQLMLVVTRAATECDRAVKGEGTDFAAARHLARVIKQWLPGPVSLNAPIAQFDVNTVGVVSRAFPAAQTRRISDVVNESWEIAEKLETADINTEKERLAECRHFCVSLGHSLLSFRASVDRYRPTNPYKR